MITRITEEILCQAEKMHEKHIIPAYVIVGQTEYDEIIAHIKSDPIQLTSKDGIKIFDCFIVPDFNSKSRITVSFDVGLRNNYMIEKAYGVKNGSI